jgi:hypothetical protein
LSGGKDFPIDHWVPCSWGDTGPAPQVDVDASPELFGPQSAVNKPLLEPHRFERSRCHLGDQGEDVWRAEGPESLLRARVHVGVTRIEARRHVQQDQAGVEVRFVKRVKVDVHSQIPQIADEAAVWVELIGVSPILAVLNTEPVVKVGQIVTCGRRRCRQRRFLTLTNREGAIPDDSSIVRPRVQDRVDGALQQKLGDVGAGQVSRGEAPEKRLRGDEVVALGGTPTLGPRKSVNSFVNEFAAAVVSPAASVFNPVP